MKHVILYRIWQWTWGFLQTFVGAILWTIFRKCPHFSYHGAVATEWPMAGSISLGMFVFVSAPRANVERERRIFRRTLVHEYGHTVQSLVLGPFYLLVVGLPSIIWCGLPACERYRKKHHVSYYAMYQESWANRWGERVTREEAMR